MLALVNCRYQELYVAHYKYMKLEHFRILDGIENCSLTCHKRSFRKEPREFLLCDGEPLQLCWQKHPWNNCSTHR